MTTVVYCHKTKQVAVDSRMTTGNGLIVNDDFNKCFQNDDGRCILSGATVELEKFASLKEGDTDCGEFRVQAIQISNGKAYLCFVDGGVFLREELHHNLGIGSGGEFAWCALDFGLSAVDAVKYAVTKDCYSGGEVQLFHVEDIDNDL